MSCHFKNILLLLHYDLPYVTVQVPFSPLCLPSGELTLEEFISGAQEHPDIMEMLTKMMDLSTVLEIIVRGQKKKDIN